MTHERVELSRREEAQLHAYHDGELSAFGRWKFERKLRSASALKRELESLRSLRGLLQSQGVAGETPDLWDSIALGLPAADARRLDAASSGAGGLWWLKPVGALAATVAVAMAFFPTTSPEPAAGSVVRWIDSGDRGVVVLDDDPESTIIWVMDEAVEGAAIGGEGGMV